MTDTERLDFLEKHCDGDALLSDDQGHWAVSSDGFQNVPMNAPDDVQTTFFVRKDDWHKSIRDAVDAEIRRQDQ